MKSPRMNHPTPRIVALIACLAAASPSLLHADDQDVVEYRQHIMNTLGEHAAAIDMILKNKAPMENFSAHSKALSIVAATAKKAFEPKVAGGNAKPEVWANWADFSKRLDALTKTAADLSAATQKGGLGPTASKTFDSLACKECHDKYRIPPK